MVELGLTVKPRSSPADRLRSARALELAAKVIDGLTSSNADVENDSRKRRRLKGPEEFRGVRVDRPKAKGNECLADRILRSVRYFSAGCRVARLTML